VLRTGLADSLHVVFWGIAFLGFVTLFAVWRIPELRRAE
jgi:hypothetical protein